MPPRLINVYRFFARPKEARPGEGGELNNPTQTNLRKENGNELTTEVISKPLANRNAAHLDKRQVIIKKMLADVRVKYKKDYENIDKQMTTKKSFNETDGTYLFETDLKRGCSRRFIEDSTTSFINSFQEKCWICRVNYNARKKDNKICFFSSAFLCQFEKALEMGLPCKLPEKISRRHIINNKTIELINSFDKKHHTDEFMHEFIATTDNGKSTKRVTDEIGLNIDKLTVEIIEGKYTVHVYVSPAPEVYGNSNEMD